MFMFEIYYILIYIKTYLQMGGGDTLRAFKKFGDDDDICKL